MKKTAFFLLLAMLLTSFAACSSNEQPVETTGATTEATTFEPQTNPPPASNVQHSVKLNEDTTSTKVVVEKSTPKTEEYDGYSMVTSGAEWKAYSGIDFSLYNFVGTGNDLINMLSDAEKNPEYARYYQAGNVVFYRVNHKNQEPYRKTSANTVKSLKNIGAFVQVNAAKGRLFVYYQELKLNVSSDYSSITGEQGKFINFTFHTSIPATFNVSVTKEKQSNNNGYIHHKNLVSKKAADGSYVGTAKFTVPYTAEPGNYYINIINGSTCLQSIPFTIEAGVDERSDTYHLMLAGDWDYIRDPNYKQNMIDQFYNVYPRLMARWGTGTEPTTIMFHADSTYDGVAYASGQEIVVSTDYASANPSDLGYLSHEMTHSVQQFNFQYSGGWFTENMASYGRFRYFEWADARYIKEYNKNDSTLYFWPSDDGTSWNPYGNGCLWFFAYMDYHWPTTQDANGNRVNGLIDIINFEIKGGRLLGEVDNPYDTENMFNKIVKEVTGYDCIEDIRKQYEADFKSGEWDFKGFKFYEGNFMTENLPNVVNPKYPQITEKDMGDKTAAKLETPVTEGENLVLGATIPEKSGQNNDNEAVENLIDGNPDTKWGCTAGAGKDRTYSLDGTRQWVIIDLGEKTTFNTYTIYNTKTKEPNRGNMSEWTIALSDDGENWKVVDYQVGCEDNIASFNIGKQSARYILIRGYNVDGNLAGAVRLYEFQLYNK